MSEQHLGVSSLRQMNKKTLAEQQDVIVIHEHLEPIAALIPYPLYMKWQEAYQQLSRLSEGMK